MKICIVGPGSMPIPPRGWGAVEILIDDYRKNLSSLGHEVHIVNTRDRNMLVWLVNSLNPDFVHVQYDEFADVIPHIDCKNVALTSHYGYLEQSHRWDPGYVDIFWNCVNSGANMFTLSPGIADVYRKAGVQESRIHVVPNGVRSDLFTFEENCFKPNESAYLAKVDPRKRQSFMQGIEGLKFIGNCVDPNFDTSSHDYLGEWTKDKIYKELTKFANLVLLSDGEAHPLVCMEALSAGLGLVISRCAAANLDTSLPFITVIEEDMISDKGHISSKIDENRKVSVRMRNEIREYGKTFDWSRIIENIYLPKVELVMTRGR
jgi:glycosyltransferase involved in cell wall biosynthesis